MSLMYGISPTHCLSYCTQTSVRHLSEAQSHVHDAVATAMGACVALALAVVGVMSSCQAC